MRVTSYEFDEFAEVLSIEQLASVIKAEIRLRMRWRHIIENNSFFGRVGSARLRPIQ